jgi:hypothetical protein
MTVVVEVEGVFILRGVEVVLKTHLKGPLRTRVGVVSRTLVVGSVGGVDLLHTG